MGLIDRIFLRDAVDGGKGSGNFGHKGRPGQVGGSGKGGAKANSSAAKSSSVAYSDGHGGLTGQGALTSSYKSKHVTDEDRKSFRDFVDRRKSSMRMYGGMQAKGLSSAGMQVRDEIAKRVRLRKKAKDLPDWNPEGQVQTEDIYDVLRDCRSFGATTDEAKAKVLPVVSELSQERTDAIVQEALEAIPTDWLEQAEFPVEIHIVNASGRAAYHPQWTNNNGAGVIVVHAKESPSVVRDLDLPTDELTDMAIANQLRHELGHYIEESNYGIGSLCREYLAARTKDSPTEYNGLGEELKPDKFFTGYMGRQYSYGATEILSCCLQALGYSNPVEYMRGGTLFANAKDLDSYKFALGLLAFKDGGYF